MEDHVGASKRALERATASDVRIEIRGGQITATGWPTTAEALAVKPDGSYYTVWATAGSYIDSGPGYTVVFSCQCKGGSKTTYGYTRCYHEAALAIRLAAVGLIRIDADGRYRTTNLAGRPRPVLNLANRLLDVEEMLA